MKGKDIARAIADGGLVKFEPLDLSPETKAAAAAELNSLLKRLGIDEIKPVKLPPRY